LAKAEENQGQTYSYQSQGQLQKRPSNVQVEREPWGSPCRGRDAGENYRIRREATPEIKEIAGEEGT
jgi:hypothetical protein